MFQAHKLRISKSFIYTGSFFYIPRVISSKPAKSFVDLWLGDQNYTDDDMFKASLA